MKLVKQTQHDRSAVVSGVLQLTPKLRRDAKSLVSLYAGVDWAKVEKECDTVHLTFPSDDAVQMACQISLEIAARDPGLREGIISKIKNTLEEKGKGRDHQSDRSIAKLLSELRREQNPLCFAKLCMKAARHYPQINLTEAGLAAPPPPLDQSNFWLGSKDGLWVGVPSRLAFAEPIVDLCRRIAKANTGDNTLQLKAAEKESLRLHHRLFAECKPESFQIPVDEFVHPVCRELQKHLDAFLPKLRAMIYACVDQGKLPRLTARPKNPSASVEVESQHVMKDQLAQGPKKAPSLSNQVAGAAQKKSGVKQPYLANDTKTVMVEIGPVWRVRVDGVEITALLPKRALQALAVLSRPEQPSAAIDIYDFVKLSHKSDSAEKDSKNAFRNKRALEQLKLIVDSPNPGEYVITGYRLELNSATRESIREYLENRPARKRLRS